MAADVIHEIWLTECGTHEVSIRINDFKVIVALRHDGNPNSPFFTFNKQEWGLIKKFIDGQLTEDNTIEIHPKEQPALQ